MFISEKAEGEVRELDASLDAASLLLLRAADLIEERGWCQFALANSKGSLCVIGALHVADGSGASELEIYGRIGTDDYSRALWRVAQGVPDPLVDWNNAKWRTQAEVVAKLREVALS